MTWKFDREEVWCIGRTGCPRKASYKRLFGLHEKEDPPFGFPAAEEWSLAQKEDEKGLFIQREDEEPLYGQTEDEESIHLKFTKLEL